MHTGISCPSCTFRRSNLKTVCNYRFKMVFLKLNVWEIVLEILRVDENENRTTSLQVQQYIKESSLLIEWRISHVVTWWRWTADTYGGPRWTISCLRVSVRTSVEPLIICPLEVLYHGPPPALIHCCVPPPSYYCTCYRRRFGASFLLLHQRVVYLTSLEHSYLSSIRLYVALDR